VRWNAEVIAAAVQASWQQKTADQHRHQRFGRLNDFNELRATKIESSICK
jgi:hypothetical protein